MNNEYVEMRNKYLPKKIKTIFVFESPPSGGGYFYNDNGKTSEVLFRSMMKVVLGISPKSKSEGLSKFAEEGFLLVDPIYTPVDKLPDRVADDLILQNYDSFLNDLRELIKDNESVRIILVKANICRLLENRLLSDGFNVVNNGVMIPFPLHYHFDNFKNKVTFILNN